MVERKRCYYLDAIKALAMFLVCVYHFPAAINLVYQRPFSAGVLLNRFFRAFDSICVPLFMMVNGALLLNRPFDAKKHALRFGQLFLGMHVWYLLTVIGIHWWNHGAQSVVDNLSGILYSMMYMVGYDGAATHLFWFVKMLLAVYALFPLMKCAYDSGEEQIKKGSALFILVLLVTCFAVKDFSYVRSVLPGLTHVELSVLGEMSPFPGLYGAMIVYFVLGGWLHRHYNKVTALPWRVSLLLIAAGWGMLFVEWYLMTIRYDAFYDIVSNSYDCLSTLMLTAGVFMALAKIERRMPVEGSWAAPIVSFLGRNALAVYYLHWLLGHTVMQLISDGGFAAAYVRNALLIAACALIGEALRRLPLLRRMV